MNGNSTHPDVTGRPLRLASPSGLSVEWNANGSLRRIDAGDITLNLYLGNGAEGGLANLYLRRLGTAMDAIPLLGPRSPATYQFGERTLTAHGRWGMLAFRAQFVIAESSPAWFWHIDVSNLGPAPVTCDLIHVQDLALAHYGAARLNEYYVCHYLDHTPLLHNRVGVAVASRQNLPMGDRHPWVVIGSRGRGVSYSTDALQFHGLATRAGGPPAALATGLPGSRLQHEHALVAIQDEPFMVAPGEVAARGFFGCFLADKPTPTSAGDVVVIDAALALPEASSPSWPAADNGDRPAASLFVTAPLLETQDLEEKEITRFFGPSRHHAEREGGRLLSFFTTANRHVVLKAKELASLRPHGCILRSGKALVPDEAALTSTAWMGGVFHSMVTQGHVSINRFLSTRHSYLDLFRCQGQRIFVEIDGSWRLLGVPSAFEMDLAACRWIYKHPGGVIDVSASAPATGHELRLSVSVADGTPCRFLFSHHLAINGDDGNNPARVDWRCEGRAILIKAIPDSDVGRRFPDGVFVIEPAESTRLAGLGGDEWLFADRKTQGQPFLCLVTEPTCAAGMTIRGRLIDAPAVSETADWSDLGGVVRINAPAASPLAQAAEREATIVPWFIQNALVHTLSPRGLEQYSGGGWGTRDVCQGPVELLLALGRPAPIRDLLCRVFRQQNPDGDWPQWFMFFDRERNIRPGDSHGDIVFWPLLALAGYLNATGDAGLLEESIPFFHADGDDSAEQTTLLGHVERALVLISNRVIEGTVLAAYGHGDWNDSLQPAEADMRARLCSSWTVTLHYQTLVALASAFRHLGLVSRALPLDEQAARVLEAFQNHLIVDGVVAGLAYFHDGGKTDFMLHPGDHVTGLSYSLLPMIHAVINDMFTPVQADHHLALIREHLLGPEGAHLFDRPLAYRGGMQTRFQRAETASYFGREIGNMYMHAHLRYVEALARHGDAEEFFRALAQSNPIALRELVPSATLRQANCYTSSTDPAFADRYEAYEHYDRVGRGAVALDGGWRVYSSGAGIGVRLVMQCFLGLRYEHDALWVDPVIPHALDGLQATVHLGDLTLAVMYHVGAKGCGPIRVRFNGEEPAFTREPNAYRPGAIQLAMAGINALRLPDVNRLEVWIG